MQSREAGDVSSFAEMLDNIFSPLFAVSIDPSCDPALHYFLGTYLTKLHHDTSFFPSDVLRGDFISILSAVFHLLC